MKKITTLISLCILVNTAIIAQNGTITTVAGHTVTIGFSGDGGVATAAELSGPTGIYSDGSGNIFIADKQNNRIRKVTASGNITTVAGNGTEGFSGDGGAATAAELSLPTDLYIDGSGNIFIADANNNRVRKITASGNITTVAGNGTHGFGGDGGPATSAELSYPTSIYVDGSGNIFIADAGNSRIRKVTASGNITTVAGNGTAGFSGDGGPATSAALYAPTGVYLDGSGNIFIADVNNNRVRKVTASGNITTVAGNGTHGFSGDGGTATSAELKWPSDIYVDGSGDIFIADGGNNRIREVIASGNITTVAGNGTAGFSGDGGLATAAELNTPTGLYLDGSGNILIADSSNNRIRKVIVLQPVITASGSATFCQGTHLTLDAGSGYGGYLWSPGGGRYGNNQCNCFRHIHRNSQ